MKKPRKVHDREISPYQGTGGVNQLNQAQARKRRQVRNRERNIWDNIAPREHHGVLWLVYLSIFAIGLAVIFSLNFG